MDHIVNQAAKLHSMFGGQFTVPMVIAQLVEAVANWERPIRKPLTPSLLIFQV